MDPTAAITAFTTLFLVIDPIGTAPIFMALTGGMTPSHRRAVALRACVIGFCILTVFGLVGRAVLEGLGISLAAFRIAGGLMLFLVAMEMLFERRTARREGQGSADDSDPSVFPLAMPLVAGPAAMATMILLRTGSESDWLALAVIHAMMGAVVAICLAMFLLAGPIERLLGRTGVLVVTRLLGMLLAALAVQFVLDGLAGLGLLPVPAPEPLG